MTITIDFELSHGDTAPATEQIAETLDEIIAEAIAGGAFDFASDTEVLSYQVIADD